jgi:hypothetical protein
VVIFLSPVVKRDRHYGPALRDQMAVSAGVAAKYNHPLSPSFLVVAPSANLEQQFSMKLASVQFGSMIKPAVFARAAVQPRLVM